MPDEYTTYEWKADNEHYRRDYAKHIACKDVPIEVLEKVRVADLLEENEALLTERETRRARFLESTGQLIEENEALRALLREWFIAGAEPLEELVERTRAVLDTIEKGEK